MSELKSLIFAFKRGILLDWIKVYYIHNFFKRLFRVYPWSDYHWRMMEKYERQGNVEMAMRHWRSHKS